ncbi:MAG: efflux RND transporter periplasmic adaptor subunit [Gammaproteobacteria bacterium]
MKKSFLIGLALLTVAGASFWLGRQSRSNSGPTPAAENALYWYDPMRPDQHFVQPGKSPFMDMQLVPKYAEAGDTAVISIDPRTAQNLGVRTAPVRQGPLPTSVQANGAVEADERRIEVVQSRTTGWVERLEVRAANDPVRRGQLLAEIYSPDLLAAQQELLLALRAGDAGGLIAGARQRLSLLGLSGQQIAQVERSGKADRRVAFYAPGDGIVTELGIRQGMQVNPGMTLFKLVDLSRVWITAEIPEARVEGVAVGQAATASVAALPGQVFQGQVDYVYPEVVAETRTLKVRIAVPNRGLLLKPGMYASVTVGSGAPREALLVPSEAVIRTGTRDVVILADGEGRFRPVSVVVGAEVGEQTEIRAGLKAGQLVVTSGQFLLDSEANLRGALDRLEAPPEAAP